MTRVTAPREIAKLTRSLSTTAAAPRPSRLPNNFSKTVASRARKELEQQHDASASERTMTTTHRPSAAGPPAPSPNRVVPLMQCFHTTPQVPRPQADPAAMDFAVLPSPEMLYPGFGSSGQDALSSGRIRVPLLPDNFAPARSAAVGHLPEAADGPPPAPQIVVVAADHPDRVSAVSPLTEVEGMGPDGVELKFVHGRSASSSDGGNEGDYAGGMLRNLWGGFVDDVLGAAQGNAKPSR